MRIWLLQDRLRSGGTERQTVLLARAFHASGHEVTVVTFRPGGVLKPTLGTLPHRVLQGFDTGLNWFAPGLVRVARAAAPEVVLCMGRMANCYAGRLAHMNIVRKAAEGVLSTELNLRNLRLSLHGKRDCSNQRP